MANASNVRLTLRPGSTVVDPITVDLDPRPQVVGEAEPVSGLQGAEVVDAIGWRVVVVGDADLEGHPHGAGDRLGGDPRERDHAAFDAHPDHLAPARRR
jgi:hypothetical protein